MCHVLKKSSPGAGESNHNWNVGEVALPLYGVRLGVYFHIPIKLGLLFPLEIHPELLVEQ